MTSRVYSEEKNSKKLEKNSRNSKMTRKTRKKLEKNSANGTFSLAKSHLISDKSFPAELVVTTAG
jgi:hypothetical protein